MKKFVIIITVLLVLVFALAFFVSCDNSVASEPNENPILKPTTQHENKDGDSTGYTFRGPFVLFDLGLEGAQFSFGSATTTRQVTVYSKLNKVYIDPAPEPTQIISPSGVSFDGWYFEDGSEVNNENYLHQTADENMCVRAVAHWANEERVFFDVDIVGDYRKLYGYSFYWSNEATERLNAYCGTVGNYKYVLRNDLQGLTEHLPSRNGIEVRTTQDGQSVILPESFDRFEWKIVCDDSTLEGGALIDLTESNWNAVLDSASIKSIKIKLDYSLKDLNKQISLSIGIGGDTTWFNSITRYRYSTNLTDEYLQRFATVDDNNFSNKVAPEITVDRNDYESVLQILPTAADVVAKRMAMNGEEEEDWSNYVESLEWSIVTYKDSWMTIYVDEILPLNQENWNKITSKYLKVYLYANCVLNDEKNVVDVNIYLANAIKQNNEYLYLNGKYLYLTVKDNPLLSYIASKEKFGAYLTVETNDFEYLLANLPTLTDIIVTQRLDNIGEYKYYKINLASVTWKLRYVEFLSENAKIVDLTEENWQYAIHHSFPISIIISDYSFDGELELQAI